jgi:uncharacterized protein (DUF305 family)
LSCQHGAVTPPTTPDVTDDDTESAAPGDTSAVDADVAAAGAHDAGYHGGDGEDVGIATAGTAGLSWAKVAVLGAALVFLGFAIGVFANRDRSPAADSVDVGFLHDMLTHHEQALGVAALTVAYGDDPTVRSYAREVITAQAYEQGLMSQMLFDWGYSRSDRPNTAMGWMDMEAPLEQMPGLLSDEQMDQLDAARGAEMDALFLEMMSEHHLGGIHMAEYAAEEAGDPDIRELADRMVRAQSSEINEYRHTVDELGFDIDIPEVAIPPVDLPGDS